MRVPWWWYFAGYAGGALSMLLVLWLEGWRPAQPAPPTRPLVTISGCTFNADSTGAWRLVTDEPPQFVFDHNVIDLRFGSKP